ncbi:hypothetical protein KAI68_07320, partial [bacterium]|nr:hypothetical protein [bacterium]
NNIEELLNKLKTYKITHLLFDPKKLDRVSFKNFSLNSLGDKKEIFDDFFDKNLENIYQKNNILLYRVKYGK